MIDFTKLSKTRANLQRRRERRNRERERPEKLRFLLWLSKTKRMTMSLNQLAPKTKRFSFLTTQRTMQKIMTKKYLSTTIGLRRNTPLRRNQKLESTTKRSKRIQTKWTKSSTLQKLQNKSSSSSPQRTTISVPSLWNRHRKRPPTTTMRKFKQTPKAQHRRRKSLHHYLSEQ